MGQHGTETVVSDSSEAASLSVAGSSMASEDSDDEIIDLETVVATVQGTRDN